MAPGDNVSNGTRDMSNPGWYLVSTEEDVTFNQASWYNENTVYEPYVYKLTEGGVSIGELPPTAWERLEINDSLVLMANTGYWVYVRETQ